VHFWQHASPPNISGLICTAMGRLSFSHPLAIDVWIFRPLWMASLTRLGALPFVSACVGTTLHRVLRSLLLCALTALDQRLTQCFMSTQRSQ
jgi:hypothetical protein